MTESEDFGVKRLSWQRVKRSFGLLPMRRRQPV